MAAEAPQVWSNRASRACWFPIPCWCKLSLPLVISKSHLILVLKLYSFSVYKQIARLFTEASQMNPEDADVHIVLGVLFNLSREFDRAMTSFQTALQLKPNDYSLWNKLGATQANSVQSADAISAYQQVNCSIPQISTFLQVSLFLLLSDCRVLFFFLVRAGSRFKT